jgi:hypothetical protein
MSQPFATVTYTARSEKDARDTVLNLINLSMWFKVCPLPCDEWEITIKNERPDLAFPEAAKLRHNWPCVGGSTTEGGGIKSISQLCRAVIKGYATGMSGLDDKQLGNLTALGDSAEQILDCLAGKAALLQLAEAMVTCIRTERNPFSNGWEDGDGNVEIVDTIKMREVWASAKKVVAAEKGEQS